MLLQKQQAGVIEMLYVIQIDSIRIRFQDWQCVKVTWNQYPITTYAYRFNCINFVETSL